ncbi:hypothetical protein G6L94_20945 [Agrobacterium rhizogenes]|uniref:hypothetical protein n=1 Tax=Rhizobium rhizogenes TaxID=359 RepID=UPI0004D5E494|nr:hypothetical protein [Rhizobium rhizogenes]OCJ19105.1 hypothetical protein A6U88_12495 [Agrobacterium sp. B131/95]OCJ20950.1 hypothetical protein A6U89_13395 [Agrobacterium sp. B133/95]KEA03437.1 hypothetical protein CN09_30650 [Rhizobium rhizogenes]MQB32811.1 hypothetical protein [Rhizobium rhizogenes]NTF70526.1 hypothetical protein [Rhizobium rhizogenes]
MSMDCTRTGEALLAGAGCPPPYHQNCDFRLDRAGSNEWEITVLSPSAQAWVRDEICYPLGQSLGDSFRVDILSANQFMKQAQARGFRSEFVGTGGKDLF